MTTDTFSPSSKNRLTAHDLDRFPTDTLFDRIGRAVCLAACLPRKELFEAWEVARRSRRVFRGGRVVDLGGGHGLLAHMMLLLDDTSPSAVVVDQMVPPSASVLHSALISAWPRLERRVVFQAGDIESVALTPADVVVSCHGCGALTDRVVAAASAVKARVAVLPCCHDAETCDPGPLVGWMDVALAIDTMRAVRLEAAGYRVRSQTIPETITPQNRLLLAEPHSERLFCDRP